MHNYKAKLSKIKTKKNTLLASKITWSEINHHQEPTVPQTGLKRGAVK